VFVSKEACKHSSTSKSKEQRRLCSIGTEGLRLVHQFASCTTGELANWVVPTGPHVCRNPSTEISDDGRMLSSDLYHSCCNNKIYDARSMFS